MSINAQTFKHAMRYVDVVKISLFTVYGPIIMY